MPQSFSEVIDLFGGPAAYARATEMPVASAKAAKIRNSIGSRWFSVTAKAAKELDLPVDEKVLSELAERRRAD